jgi:hypothetical protein
MSSQLTAPPIESAVLPPGITQIAASLFPGPVTVDREFDPEAPMDPFWVVSVEASGSFEDIIRRQCEWHEKIRPIACQIDVRLSINPRDE